MKHLMIILEYRDHISMVDIKTYAQAALETTIPYVKAPKSKMKAVGNVSKPRREKSQRIA